MKHRNGKKILSVVLTFALFSFMLCINVSATQAQTAVKYSFGFSWVNHIAPRQYYVGDKNAWNDYGVNSTEAYQLTGTAINVNLNDPGYTTSKAGEIRTVEYTGKTWNDADWGWAGLGFGYMTGTQNLNDVPDEYWGDVLDISDSVDSGYAVFEINVTNAAGIDSAYFTITAASNEWAVPGAGNNGDSITKENYPNLSAQQHYCTLVSGEKLTDYYDVSTGGKQLIKIPLSKFTDGEGFMDSYGKNWGAQTGATVTQWTRLNPKLFSGMGIARKKSTSLTPLGFSANITAMAIVAPTPPANFSAVQNEDGSVSMSWDAAAESDVTFKVIRTGSLGTKYFDAGTATTYTDTSPDPDVYKYSVAAVDNKYGIMAESEKIIISAVGAPSDALKYSFSFFYDNNISQRAFYVGEKNTWFDYGLNKTSGLKLQGKNGMLFNLNDNGYIPDSKVGEIALPSYADEKTWNETGWGWTGLNFGYMTNNKNDLSQVPDEFWGDVFDLSDYIDNGYAIFEINLDNAEGANETYFALTAALGIGALSGGSSGSGDKITKTNYPGLAAQAHKAEFVTGVKLTDYYDVNLGGKQIIKIPLSKFVNDADFRDSYGKNWNNVYGNVALATITNSTVFDLRLFSGMGLARKNSTNETPLGFKATVTTMAIVAPKAPLIVSATKNDDNSVSVSWLPSTDAGVTYKVVRKAGNEKIMFDAGTNLSYTDTTTENGKKYTYSVVAVESTYGAISSESTGIEVDFPLFASVTLYAGTGESKIESAVAVDGDMTAQFYSPLKAAKGYVAIYDGERYMTRFIPVSINTSDGFVDIVIENCQSTDTIKAFLWDSDMNILDKAAVSVAQS